MKTAKQSALRPLASLPHKDGERKFHGMNKTVEHQAWVGMRQRCYNPNKRSYKTYGARGITVCERWALFINFYNDVGPRPGPGYSIDRIDVNGNYEPGNVRWATVQQQAENTTAVKLITHKGITRTTRGWERAIGVTRNAVANRIKAGWSIEKAIETPVIPGQKIYPGPPVDTKKQHRNANGQLGKLKVENEK